MSLFTEEVNNRYVLPFSLQKIPPMDEILAEINGTITDVELVSNDTRKAINDTFTSGVQEIEFFKYSIEVKSALSQTFYDKTASTQPSLNVRERRGSGRGAVPGLRKTSWIIEVSLV